jgi:hypothetical protein
LGGRQRNTLVIMSTRLINQTLAWHKAVAGGRGQGSRLGP